jgi:hypothetical protein
MPNAAIYLERDGALLADIELTGEPDQAMNAARSAAATYWHDVVVVDEGAQEVYLVRPDGTRGVADALWSEHVPWSAQRPLIHGTLPDDGSGDGS